MKLTSLMKKMKQMQTKKLIIFIEMNTKPQKQHSTKLKTNFNRVNFLMDLIENKQFNSSGNSSNLEMRGLNLYLKTMILLKWRKKTKKMMMTMKKRVNIQMEIDSSKDSCQVQTTMKKKTMTRMRTDMARTLQIPKRGSQSLLSTKSKKWKTREMMKKMTNSLVFQITNSNNS